MISLLYTQLAGFRLRCFIAVEKYFSIISFKIILVLFVFCSRMVLKSQEKEEKWGILVFCSFRIVLIAGFI